MTATSQPVTVVQIVVIKRAMWCQWNEDTQNGRTAAILCLYKVDNRTYNKWINFSSIKLLFTVTVQKLFSLPYHKIWSTICLDQRTIKWSVNWFCWFCWAVKIHKMRYVHIQSGAWRLLQQKNCKIFFIITVLNQWFYHCCHFSSLFTVLFHNYKLLC